MNTRIAGTAPRISIARRLEALPSESAKSYACYIQAGDDGRMPCWGAIAERFDSDFETDEERLDILDALIEEGDRRPLFLFVHLARSRPELLGKLIRQARRLPLSVQQCLVSLPEAAECVRSQLKHFCPAVQSAYRNDPNSLKRDQERFENRIRELLAFRFYVPDICDPQGEGDAGSEEVA